MGEAGGGGVSQASFPGARAMPYEKLFLVTLLMLFLVGKGAESSRRFCFLIQSLTRVNTWQRNVSNIDIWMEISEKFYCL